MEKAKQHLICTGVLGSMQKGLHKNLIRGTVIDYQYGYGQGAESEENDPSGNGEYRSTRAVAATTNTAHR